MREGHAPHTYDDTVSPGVKRSPASGMATANMAALQQRYAQRVSATRLDGSHRQSDMLTGVVGEAVRRRRHAKRASLQRCKLPYRQLWRAPDGLYEFANCILQAVEYSLFSLCDGPSVDGGKDIMNLGPSNLCSIGHLRSSRVTK